MKTLHKALYNRILTRTLVYMIVVVLVLAVSIPGLASGGEVTSGASQTFAAGVGRGYDVGGHRP